MNKKHQKNKITLIITAISAVLMASLFTVANQLTSNALAQTITNQSDVAIIETQTANISNMGNKIKTPITEINNTEIGRATPTTDQ
ncbi:MAG TPA: hypothetical protein VE445_04360 [Nitrososphaeraceae archaeon]|nr:hypothetical protein [Nitrososphaeraceae archaeon]